MNRAFVALSQQAARRLLVLLVVAAGGVTLAQEGPKQEVIDLAAAHPALTDLLASHPGWYADAYATGNSYGVWRVQFYFAGGSELGWADVSPEREQVYAWEASYELTGEQNVRAQRALYRFVRQNPEVRALVGDSAPLEKWFWYDSWREGWFVHLERGADSLDVSVRSRRKGSLELRDLFVEKIYFPTVLAFADYQEANRSSAVSLAFAEPEIAAALRDTPGWTSTGEQTGGDLWQIQFLLAGKPLATAEVDVRQGTVRTFTVNP